MTSVEIPNSKHFDELKQKLSTDIGRELTESEFIELILKFGTDNYDKLVHASSGNDIDESITQEQLDYLFSKIVKDTTETDLSQTIDETLYGM